MGMFGDREIDFIKILECFLNENINYLIWMTQYKGYQ